MKIAARPLHRRLAPWLVAPLLLSALTGLTYRIGRTYFGFSRETGHEVLALHTGAWMGETGALLYTTITGLGLLALALGGAALLWSSRSKNGPRRLHRGVAWVLLPPLVVTAATGLAYHLGEAWFGFAPETLKLLLNLHQGSWLGPTLRPFYIIFVGGGLLFLLGTGLAMLRKRTPRTSTANEHE